MAITTTSQPGRKRSVSTQNRPSTPRTSPYKRTRRKTADGVLNQAKASGPPTVRRAVRNRPDFWHTSFGPLVEKVRLEKGNKHLESEFFDSLSNFARLYSLDLPQKESFGFFPTNIDAGFLLASEHLKRINPKAHLELVTSDDGAFCLCSYSFADKSYELYHLGLNEWIAPLLNQPLTLEVSLLASVLAYLIQVAGVPFYGNKTSFAAWQYEAVKDYFEEQILETPDCDTIFILNPNTS